MANCSFPATSASAERAFNMDGLIVTPSRHLWSFSLSKINTVSYKDEAGPEEDRRIHCLSGLLDVQAGSG